jgi:putative flippase GtrA
LTVSRLPRLALPKSGQITRNICYVLVGATCAVLNNVLLIAVAAAGFDYLASSLIICVPMLVVGFTLHSLITFKTKATISAFLRYSGAILANYPVLIAILFLLCDVAHLPVFVAGPIATIALFVWNYVFTHWALARTIRAAPYGVGLQNKRGVP